MSGMMKRTILFVIGAPGFNYANPNSAVAKYLVTLADALSEKGFTVLLVPAAPSPSPSLSPSPSPSLLGKIKKLVRRISPYLYNTLVDKAYFKKQEIIFNETSLLAPKADIILEFLTYGSDIGARLAQAHGKPLAVIFDSPLPEQYLEMYAAGSMYGGRIEKAEARSVKAAETIICYSQPVKEHVLKTYEPKGSIEILPCIVWKGGVERKASREQLIGFIGSFLKWHKVELLLTAFKTIGKEFPSAKLVLVGFGQEWHRIRAMADLHPYKERIIMTGFVNEEELIAWKQKLTVGVMPGSNWYGSPLKLFEYAEAMIPVIAPASPTVASLFVKNREALFIEAGDEAGSLTMNIRRMLNDEGLRMELARNAFKKMNGEFARHHQTLIFTEVILKILESGSEK